MPDGLLVPLLDKVIQLARLRQVEKRKLFEDHIDPLFRDLQEVTGDYIKILGRLRNILETNDCEVVQSALIEAKNMVADARLQLRLKRVELRVIFDDEGRSKLCALSKEVCVQEFVANSCRLVGSWFSTAEYGTDTSLGTLFFMALGDALKQTAPEFGENDVDSRRAVAWISGWSTRVLDQIESAWADVSSSYHACRVELFR